jgi:Protein of unknown function (DUF2911)
MIHRAAIAATALAVASFASAHDNGRGEASLALGGKTISVEYGRPSLQGRDMLGQAQPGMVWRMGADAQTSMTSEATLAFGDQTLEPGRYELRAKKVSDTEWHLLVGDADAPAATVPFEVSTLPESVETFTIELAGEGTAGTLTAKWGDKALSAAFTAR